MKEDIILENVNNPDKLEEIYHKNPSKFKGIIDKLYEIYPEQILFRFWKIRLNYKNNYKIKLFSDKATLLYFMLTFILSIIYFNIGSFINIPEEFLYNRNLSFIIIVPIIFYLRLQKKFIWEKSILLIIPILIQLTYVNILPSVPNSDVLNWVWIYSPVLLWYMILVSFVNFDLKNYEKILEFLRLNGNVLVLNTIILISGLLFNGIVSTLFYASGFAQIDLISSYVNGILIPLGAMTPLITVHIVTKNPNLVNKIPSLIAFIFTPLVIVIFAIYIIMALFGMMNFGENRELLIILNALLIAVMAIIIFLISNLQHKFKTLYLKLVLIMIIETIIINIIGLVMIFYRVMEGFTPNRTNIIVINLMVFVHLIYIGYIILKILFKKINIQNINTVIARQIPFYVIWFIIVVYIFPFLFNFE